MAILIIFILVLFAVLAIVLFIIRFATTNRGTPGEMSCGACGYSVRAISELKCPECGADLTEAGIIKGGRNNTAVIGCLLPFAYTLMLPVLAAVLFGLLVQFLPTYAERNVGFSVNPASRQYGEVLFETEFTEIIPAGGSTSSNVSTNTTGGTSPVANITIASPNTKITVQKVWIEVMTSYPNSVNTYAPSFEIDLQSREASWLDGRGSPRRSNGPFTDQDVLAYLDSTGVDTTRADVKAEAKVIQATIDGLVNGSQQFTLNGFDSAGHHAGSSGMPGPPWLLFIYAIAWLLIWVIGLVFLILRARRPAP